MFRFNNIGLLGILVPLEVDGADIEIHAGFLIAQEHSGGHSGAIGWENPYQVPLKGILVGLDENRADVMGVKLEKVLQMEMKRELTTRGTCQTHCSAARR